MYIPYSGYFFFFLGGGGGGGKFSWMLRFVVIHGKKIVVWSIYQNISQTYELNQNA